MKRTTLPGESNSVTNQHVRQSPGKAETSEIHLDPMVKAQLKLRQTYHEYEEAQKGFIKAFQDREKDNREAFIYSEKKYKTYEEVLEVAFNNRETAEYKALEDYRKTIENAQIMYVESMKKALIDCKISTERARNLLTGIHVKRVEPISIGPVLISLHINRPDLEMAKQRIVNFSQWFKGKKTLFVQKLHRNSQTVKTENIVEQ